MSYMSCFKSMSIRSFYPVDLGDQKLPIGSTVNLIREILDLETIPDLYGSDTIDRFNMYHIVSEIIGNKNKLSRWEYKYPTLIASTCLFMPDRIIYDEPIKGRELTENIFPYVRLLESQNRITYHATAVDDNGISFKVYDCRKISTALPVPIDHQSIGTTAEKRYNDRLSHFTVGSKTPHAVHNHVRFVSTGDRYSRSLEYRDHFKVLQLTIMFKLPNNRYFGNSKDKTFCTLANVIMTSLDRKTGKIVKHTIGSLIVKSDRVLRLRMNTDTNTIVNTYDPLSFAHLLSLIGVRSKDLVKGRDYKLSNIPSLSQFSDPLLWKSLGFEAFNVPRSVYIRSFSLQNEALRCEIVKSGRDYPSVTYR